MKDKKNKSWPLLTEEMIVICTIESFIQIDLKFEFFLSFLDLRIFYIEINQKLGVDIALYKQLPNIDLFVCACVYLYMREG